MLVGDQAFGLNFIFREADAETSGIGGRLGDAQLAAKLLGLGIFGEGIDQLQFFFW